MHFVLLSVAAAVKVAQIAPELLLFDGYDSTGGAVIVEPFRAGDPAVQKAYVNPKATQVTFDLQCKDGQQLYVDGVKSSPGKINFKRNKSVHSQLVEIVCGSEKTTPKNKKSILLIQSDYPLGEIQPPSLFMDEMGVDCEFTGSSIKCPNPKTSDGLTHLTVGCLSDVEYVLHSQSNSTELRLLNGKRTIPLQYKQRLAITAKAGRFSKTWPVSFGGSVLHTIFFAMGCVLAGILAILLFTLLVVLCAADVIGHGVPLGATEIGATLTMIIQYFSFANRLRGSTTMASITTPLKWVTMFWPTLIVNDAEQQATATHPPEFSKVFALKLWNMAALGDVDNILNIQGCIFWCVFLIVVCAVIHGLVFISVQGSRFTVPHRFQFGNWEYRLLNWLCFPLATAATLAVLHPATTTFILITGSAVLFTLFLWIASSTLSIATAVNGGKVIWVWEHSVRESGASKNEESQGYWCDAVCDQLTALPVNRGICGDLFQYKWVSTVADIQPIRIHHGSNPTKFKTAPKLQVSYEPAGYPLAKNPQVVVCEKARCPSSVYRGHRLIAGVLRTSWLDLLYTYEGVTKFMQSDKSETNLPLLVKTHQLNGSLTNGVLAFFYDGARIPFIRIAESIWKILTGVFLAIAITANSEMCTRAAYGMVGAVSIMMCIYIMSVVPYSRKLDNCMVGALAALIGGSAFAFVFNSYKTKSCAADAFMIVLLIAACLLAVYAVFMIISVFAAITCPPIDESKFMERLANCTARVQTADEFDEYELSAYSKNPPLDVAGKSRFGRTTVNRFGSLEEVEFHFNHYEIAHACSSGDLPYP